MLCGELVHSSGCQARQDCPRPLHRVSCHKLSFSEPQFCHGNRVQWLAPAGTVKAHGGVDAAPHCPWCAESLRSTGTGTTLPARLGLVPAGPRWWSWLDLTPLSCPENPCREMACDEGCHQATGQCALPTRPPTCETKHITGPRRAGGSWVTGLGREELLELHRLCSPCPASPETGEHVFTFCLVTASPLHDARCPSQPERSHGRP